MALSTRASTLALLVSILLAWNFCATVHARRRGHKSHKPCFRDEREAGSIGSLHLAQFFRDLQSTNCGEKEVFEVYKKSFANDLTFSVNGVELVRIAGCSVLYPLVNQFTVCNFASSTDCLTDCGRGNPECWNTSTDNFSDLNGLNAAFIETGVVSELCRTTILSWSTAEVTILKPGKSFMWKGNENFLPPDPNPNAPPPGREYVFKVNRRTCNPTLVSINAVGGFEI